MQTSELNPYPNNPRKHTDGAMAALQASLEEFGDLSGVIYNIKTDQLIGGHMRLKVIPSESIITSAPASDKQGTTARGTITLPDGTVLNYREVDWPAEKHEKAVVAANSEHLQGSWDKELLNIEIESIFQHSEPEDFATLRFDEFSFPETDMSIPDDFGDNDPTEPEPSNARKIPLFLQVIELEPEDHRIWKKLKQHMDARNDNEAVKTLIYRALAEVDNGEE